MVSYCFVKPSIKLLISLILVSIRSFKLLNKSICFSGFFLSLDNNRDRHLFINFLLILKDKATVLCHALRIYIYLIESSPAVKRISRFQFFYTLILIRQKVYKILLFLKNSCEMQNLRKYSLSVC